MALLVDGAVPPSLRLLGLWSRDALAPLKNVLVRSATVGFFIAVVAGLILFGARATSYASSQIFLGKMILSTAGIVNAAAMRIPAGTRPQALRIFAVISLLVRPLVLVFGRLIGFF